MFLINRGCPTFLTFFPFLSMKEFHRPHPFTPKTVLINPLNHPGNESNEKTVNNGHHLTFKKVYPITALIYNVR